MRTRICCFDFDHRGVGQPVARGAGERLSPGHRGDAAQSRAGRLAELAAHRQRVGLQPARSDQPAERPAAAARVVVGDGRHRRAGGDAARVRRRHVSAQPARRHSGARRRNRRPALGVPPEVAKTRACARAARRGRRTDRHPAAGAAARRGRRRSAAGSRRNIAIFGDKIFGTTNDAHIVALDARTGKLVWDTTVADSKLGYEYTSGPIVVRGKVIAGITGLQPLQGRRLLHHRPRCGDRKRTVAHVDHRPSRRARRRHLGRPAADLSRRQRRVDLRQLRSGRQSGLLGHGAGQAVGQSRRAAPTATRSIRTRRWRSIPTPAR